MPFPGNDDASRAVSLYCDLIARAAIDGISRAQGDPASISALPKSRSSSRCRSRRRPAISASSSLPGPRGVADDLKKLPGVSPAIEKQLNDLGIFHFTQIAELNEKAAHNIGEEVGLPGRVDGWVAKAKELTAE